MSAPASHLPFPISAPGAAEETLFPTITTYKRLHSLKKKSNHVNVIGDLASVFTFSVFSAFSGHAVMRKWLLLNDPEDTNSSPKGYLKVSMFVLGTGDEPPVSSLDGYIYFFSFRYILDWVLRFNIHVRLYIE